MDLMDLVIHVAFLVVKAVALLALLVLTQTVLYATCANASVFFLAGGAFFILAYKVFINR
jgi:hypothetical protein